MKCPNCGAEMEDGFVAVGASGLVSIKWCKKRKLTSIGGEGLYGLLGGWIDAHRCQGCRLVTMEY